MVRELKIFETDVKYLEGDDGRPPVAIDDKLDLYVNGALYTTLYMSPTHVEETIVGVLLGDGLVRSADEIESVEVDERNKRAEVRVRGQPEAKRVHLEDCSPATLRAMRVGFGLKVPWSRIVEVYVDFNKRTISVTRGLAMHTSALYELEEGRAIVAHDTSRHTSIAKLIGIALKVGARFDRSLLITTGRASADMVTRAANVRSPIVISTRGPLYSGLTAASLLGITLVSYLRRGEQVRGLTVMTYPERILRDG
ncbi:MAG: formate dehydrogenase accessory sulfurtransferase FdhD [Acidilobaceae archaeon]|nr:formate dehydrogenase accessory sulfurtransferase FdhD [Acidilobaceae archaeon]MCX8165953.1 formate dehydrogenase accessory sulfurtransferase FdhD [Acidilobaceae archaeon]MDW7974596.1 formate dehydrogenase accessory sulfurtransferase FdhD [Sulfolobales archaeon]